MPVVILILCIALGTYNAVGFLESVSTGSSVALAYGVCLIANIVCAIAMILIITDEY